MILKVSIRYIRVFKVPFQTPKALVHRTHAPMPLSSCAYSNTRVQNFVNVSRLDLFGAFLLFLQQNSQNLDRRLKSQAFGAVPSLHARDSDARLVKIVSCCSQWSSLSCTHTVLRAHIEVSQHFFARGEVLLVHSRRDSFTLDRFPVLVDLCVRELLGLGLSF